MEITSFKVKTCILPVLTFVYSKFNIWSCRYPIDANAIILDFWLKGLQTLQISAKNNVKWGRYDFSKMTTKFCQQTGFMKKRIQITSRSIQTDIQVLISAI
jgi:hypothetical protein